MNAFAFSAYLTSFSTFIIGCFVLLKMRSAPINRIFFFYSSAIAFWAFFTATHSISQNEIISLGCAKIMHVAVPFIPMLFFHFTLVFLQILRSNKLRVILISGYALAILIVIFSLTTNLLVRDVRPKLGYSYFMDGGCLYGLVIGYFTFYSFLGLWLLAKAVKISAGMRRSQLRFLFWGSLIGYTLGAANFMPVYNLTFFPYPYGSLGIMFYVFITAYAIVRYRFLDIEVIIKRTLVFTGLFAMIMIVIGSVTTVVQGMLGRYFQFPAMFSTALSVLAAILLYDPSKRFLVNFTDKYLFQKKLDYTVLLKEASQQMAAIKSLKALSKVVVAFLIRKARIVSAAVFVQSDTGAYVIKASRPAFRQLNRILKPDHPLIEELIRLERPVDREEITNRFATTTKSDAGQAAAFKQCLELFDLFKADVVVPSFLYPQSRGGINGQNRPLLRSLLFLGPKKSDEPYTQEDLDIFFTLAQESAIAIENARLYDEAVRKTEQLREMNQELANANQRLQVTQASLIVAEKNATMAGMAKAIGHEVNNPLTTVILRIDKIHSNKVKKFKAAIEQVKPKLAQEEVTQFSTLCQSIDDDSQSAYRAAQRINAVVHTLTDILRDAKGEMGPLSLVVLFREALEAVRFSTYEENLTGCDIKVDIATNIIIFGNLEQLLQVFVNLIKNAFEAMGDGRDRKIWIRGGQDAEDPRMSRIEVEDNGPGISAELLPRIWNQGFSTKQRKDNSIGAPGQGQGLFVVKHMIESIHKGTILCESQVGRGTKFIIRLPLAEEKPL
ncbi:MAG: hypothetical protein HYZ83_03490 [Candidatus Omnitrophica bacterium]|nr:hypothetical protein [Candidatus Omnitrophota bacterium]